MKTVTPSRARSLCTFVSATFWTLFLTGGILGIWEFLVRIQRNAGIRVDDQLPAQILVAVLGVLLGGALAGRALLGMLMPSARYELGGSDIRIEKGIFWRTTQTMKMLDIDRVELSSGPLMRIFGLADLKLYTPSAEFPVTFHGIRAAEDLKRMLLERHDMLREAAEEGDLSVASTPQEMIFERLDRVLERIEKHLPPVSGKTST